MAEVSRLRLVYGLNPVAVSRGVFDYLVKLVSLIAGLSIF
jgi:hypothetical protein